MEWAALELICLLAASVYTLQFAYLTMAFETRMYSGLLTVSLLVQVPWEDAQQSLKIIACLPVNALVALQAVCTGVHRLASLECGQAIW